MRKLSYASKAFAVRFKPNAPLRWASTHCNRESHNVDKLYFLRRPAMSSTTSTGCTQCFTTTTSEINGKLEFGPLYDEVCVCAFVVAR
jgi:hypothetical protein